MSYKEFRTEEEVAKHVVHTLVHLPLLVRKPIREAIMNWLLRWVNSSPLEGNPLEQGMKIIDDIISNGTENDLRLWAHIKDGPSEQPKQPLDRVEPIYDNQGSPTVHEPKPIDPATIELMGFSALIALRDDAWDTIEHLMDPRDPAEERILDIACDLFFQVSQQIAHRVNARTF